MHPLLRLLFDAHLAEVAGHVGQQIGRRVADLVQHLLGDRGAQDAAAGAFGLGQREAAVGMALDDGVADVGPVRNLLPVGVQPTGRLAAAFDDVPGQAAAGQFVVLVGGPAELVHQGPQCDGAVDAAAGDHDVGPGLECAHDGQRTEIGIGAQHPLGQGLAAEHVALIGGSQSGHLGAHVVALDHRDAR